MSALQEISSGKSPLPPHILLMEDESSVAQGIKMVLSEEGYQVNIAMTGGAALDTFSREGADLLLADLRLPDIDGMDVIRRVKAAKPETGVIVITGYATVPSAVEAMKLGAYDYLSKPFTEDELKRAVGGALKEKARPAPAEPTIDFETEAGRLIQKREVLKALNRAVQDPEFWQELIEKGSEALEGYRLSGRAKYAIAHGDLKWITDHVGELTQKQLMFIYKRLEREAW